MNTEDKKHIGLLFNRIAHSYDRLNHLFSLDIDKLWRRRLVKQMRPVQQVLDVAIGTGDLAIEMIRQGKAQIVQGIDLSSEMMRLGAEKSKGMAIHYLEASAQEMPFTDNQFDAVTCSFGCRNFAQLDEGLREMYRVLKKDGELWILEFSYPDNRFIAWWYDLYFSHVMPTLGGWLSRDRKAYEYLNHSVKKFVWGDQFAQKLTQAGFQKITYQPLSFGIATLYYGTKLCPPLSLSDDYRTING